MPDVYIREYRLSDCQVIADIYNESIRAADCTMDRECMIAEHFVNMVNNFNDRETIFVLEKGDSIIGWGIIKRYSDRAGYRVACETAVYIMREHCGKGYGTMIKKALIERCKKYQYHHLVAKIWAQNKASIKYNKKLGYEIVGKQKQIGFVNGKWIDIVIMQLVLNDVPPYKAEIN